MDSCIRSFDGRTFYATDFCCCPRCGCTGIKKNGKTKAGRQRWICKGCGKAFTGRSGTILFSSKLKPMQIKKMLSLLIDGTTLRQACHMAKVSLQTALLWRRKIEEVRRIRESPMLSGNVHVDETYVNMAKFGELPVKRGVSNNKLRIAVVVDDLGHCMAKVSGYGMPKNQESERDFCSMIERGSHVTHDDSNYGHAFDGCAVTAVNSKSKESHFLMNPVNRFCCLVQRIFAVHLRIHRNSVQKYPNALCADYMSGKERFPEFLRENRERIFSSGIMLRRSDVYGCPATL
jgi:transposase-like protein